MAKLKPSIIEYFGAVGRELLFLYAIVESSSTACIPTLSAAEKTAKQKVP